MKIFYKIIKNQMMKNITYTILYIMVVLLFVHCSGDSVKDDPKPELKESEVHVRSVTPIKALPGAPLVILGSGFGSDPSAVAVTFDDRSAEIVSSSNEKIEVVVPDRGETESSTIRVKVGNRSSNAFVFKYDSPNPVTESLLLMLVLEKRVRISLARDLEVIKR